MKKGNSDYDLNKVRESLNQLDLNSSEMIETAGHLHHLGVDMRGGANGTRIRLDPQINWKVNKLDQLKTISSKYEEIST